MSIKHIKSRTNHYRESRKIGASPDSQASKFNFTEFLILGVVAGILTLLIFPGVSRLGEMGNRAQCRDNIRQQLVAMHLFADDYFGKGIPPTAQIGSTIGFWSVISASADNAPVDLYPNYIDDLSLFICPSTKNFIRTDMFNRRGFLVDLYTNAANREDDRGGHSYEYFGTFGPGALAGQVKTPDTVQGIEAQTILILDGDDVPGSNNCPDPSNNHGWEGSNIGFADGHVEWVPRANHNGVLEASFHLTRCPDLLVWSQGGGAVAVEFSDQEPPEPQLVPTRQGFPLGPDELAWLEAVPAEGMLFTGWTGTTQGQEPSLSLSRGESPQILIASFATNRLRLLGLSRNGEAVSLSVDNPSGMPYRVERTFDLQGEWETVDGAAVAEEWADAPTGQRQAFWRLRR